MTLRVVPEDLAAAGVGVSTLAACRAVAPGVLLDSAVVPAEVALVPPLHSVTALSVRGGEQTLPARRTEQLDRYGVGAGEPGTSCVPDAASSSPHSIAGRCL